MVEDRAQPNGLQYVRLRGGLPEQLRFFHTVDPAITRKRDDRRHGDQEPSAGCAWSSIEPLGSDCDLYDITTGTGDFIANGVVSHNCFARPTHTYLDFNAGRDFEREIVVKVNAPERRAGRAVRPSLEARARRARHQHRPVPVGREALPAHAGRLGGACATRGTPCSVLTKSPLLLRDLELFKQIPSFAGQPLDPDARREGLAGQRAAHARTRASASRRWPSSTAPASRPAS